MECVTIEQAAVRLSLRMDREELDAFEASVMLAAIFMVTKEEAIEVIVRYREKKLGLGRRLPVQKSKRFG